MTPSLAEYLIKISPASIGKKIGELGIKSLLLCGEPGAGVLAQKKRLEAAYGARVYDFWAPGGLGFGLSCDANGYHGLHCYAPDYNLYQDDLVDQLTRAPVDVTDGVVGELVHTSLEREACPVIRYAYGDVVQVRTCECPGCGFKGKRLFFLGRSDDLLIIKGMKLYPSQINEIIASFAPKVSGYFKIRLNDPLPKMTPPIQIKVEYGVGVEPRQLVELELQLKQALYQKIRVTFDIEWVSPGTFQHTSQKIPFFEMDAVFATTRPSLNPLL